MLTGAILTGMVGFAQTANLDVVLQDIQSIIVNPLNKDVTLTFTDVADYTNGVSSGATTNDHLIIVSTVDFDVTAYASQDLTDAVSTDVIPVSTISLTPSAGTGAIAGGTYPGGNLAVGSGNAITIMDAIPANLIGQYNVDYTASGGASYLNVPTGTYETIITYTLVPN